jgi:hypothetical protein
MDSHPLVADADTLLERLDEDPVVSQVQTLNTRYAATIDLIWAMGGRYGGADDQPPTFSNRR